MQPSPSDFDKFVIGQQLKISNGTNPEITVEIVNIETGLNVLSGYPNRITLADEDSNGNAVSLEAATAQLVTINGPKPTNKDETATANTDDFILHADSVVVALTKEARTLDPVPATAATTPVIFKAVMPTNATIKDNTTSANGKTYSQFGVLSGDTTDINNAKLLAVANIAGSLKQAGITLTFQWKVQF